MEVLLAVAVDVDVSDAFITALTVATEFDDGERNDQIAVRKKIKTIVSVPASVFAALLSRLAI